MKAIVKACSLVLSLGFLLSACTEQDIPGYENDPRMYFQIPGIGKIPLRDSLVYSFPAKPNVVESDVIYFDACIMGNVAPYDREIGIKVNTDSSTAVEGVNFKIQSKILPANAFKVRIPITIYKTGLKDKKVRLQLEVTDSKDFKIGYKKYNKAIFIWGDKFLKPDLWDVNLNSSYKNVFGAFTETRYDFILKACGLTELPDPNNRAMMEYYSAVVVKALVDYNASHTVPLTDELGAVSFVKWAASGGLG